MLAHGSQLGPYEIVSAIGAGGMGEVYRARDTKLNRDVALKVLPDAFVLDRDRLARFKREAQVLASLNHPNISAIYGFEESEGVHALVLELVDGPTLADRIAQGPIPFDEVLPMARQIAEALEAAHERGIIHRDLKPANIKLRPDGTVKVLDFGLAKALEPTPAMHADATASPTITSPAMTQMGVILGTAAYMSPEQAKGRAADKRGDIWAFGCVLYEMLAGRRAFEGEDISDTLASILKGEPDWTLLPADMPPAIRTLVQRCLTKNRQQRIADIAVAQFLLTEPADLAASSTHATAEVRASSRRRWAPALPTAAAALLTAALVGTTVWILRPAPPPLTVARFGFTLAEGQQFTGASRAVAAISPDGTQLVYAANSRLYLRPISELEARPIPGSEFKGGILNPVFSPDGGSVAFFAWADSTLKRLFVSGGAAVTICQATAPYGMSWGTAGIVFSQAFGQGEHGILRVSPNGGRPERIVSVKPDEMAHGPQMLPGGQAVLFTVTKGTDRDRWDKAQVVVQSLRSGERKTLIDGGSYARYLPSNHLVYALGGTLFAISFDPKRQEVIGGSAPVLEGVRRSNNFTTSVAYFSVSDSGSLLYIPGPAGTSTSSLRSVVLADKKGEISPLMLPPGPYVQVRASRDGTRLVAGSDDGREAIVWIYELAGTSAIRRLTLEGRNRFPIWSADGQRVAFQSERQGDLGIFWQRADGTSPVERLTKPGQGESHVAESWSPDGNHVSFSVIKGGTFSLWILSVEDKKASPFGNIQSEEPISSVFSPDGRWIVYSSSPASGGVSLADRGVYIQPFPATGARYQVPKDRLDFHPVWAPDGTELFYVPSAASGRFASVSLKTQPSLTFGSPSSLPAPFPYDALSSQTRAYDILPDGRFVGLVAASESDGSKTAAAAEIRVVLNWFEELKRLVPRN